MAGFAGHPTLQALLQKGEDDGTLEFGEIAAAVEELELEEGALDAFYAEAERRGIEVLDASRRTDILVGFVQEDTRSRFYIANAYLSGGEMLHNHRVLRVAIVEGRIPLQFVEWVFR